MKYIVYNNSRAKRITQQIIASEDLDLTVTEVTDALGDDMIELMGDKESIETFQDVFRMVY